jgi:hypothetical protein
MSFINNEQIVELKSKITSDLSLLGKLYKAKKNEASKNNGVSKEEVETLKIMYNHCNKTSYNNVKSAQHP